MLGRDVNRGQMLEAKAETEAKVKKAEQNTITMIIYAIETLCDSIDVFQPNK